MIPDLRDIPLFASFTDDELSCFTMPGVYLSAQVGDTLFREGDAPQGLFILLEGELEIVKSIGTKEIVLAVEKTGSFVGEISLLTGMPHNATVRITKQSRILKYDASEFDGLQESPFIRLLVSTMAERLRSTEQLIHQNEKLAGLGKIAAGLAHELNNPASASLRAAEQLPAQIISLQGFLLKLNRLKLDDGQLEFIFSLQEDLSCRMDNLRILTPLAQSDREDVLVAWMEQHGVEDAWRFASMLVNVEVDVAELERITAKIGTEAIAPVLEWLDGTLNTLDMLSTVQQSSTRIVDLINSVKDYSYMDQSPLQAVNIHDGIENTLKMLNHKLSKISVVREYDLTLPRITVYGSELNQVWTNLIDNAIDAMNGAGKLTIRTTQEAERLVVSIADNGAGIPKEIQSHIFEPFYTTKAIGNGNGIGLDIVWRIITQKHNGSIRVTSEAGNTQFEVSLPFERDDKDRG